MEVFYTLDNIVLHNNENNKSLWCNRTDARLIPAQGEKLLQAWHPKCRGLFFGLIGKIQLLPGSCWLLLLISDRQLVGFLPNAVEVYVIKKVTVLSLSNSSSGDFLVEGDFLKCPLHSESDDETLSDNRKVTQQKVQQTWNSIKSSATAAKSNILKEMKEKEKLERRLLDELVKMFNDSQSFYYSPNGDLTRSIQQQQQQQQQNINNASEKFVWREAEDKYFWNKFMLNELIQSNDELASHWILPIIQGFVQIERCYFDHLEDLNSLDMTDGDIEEGEEDWDITDSPHAIYQTGENLKEDEYDIIVISRRSRYRAGTRYRRRGVDENGNVANYVETEQIVCVLNHIVSHIQIRGSVPVYWSQPGFKYRPMPQLDRDFGESKVAFAKHFDKELTRFQNENIVTLVELTGREKVIADAFLDHVLEYDSEKLRYVVFDFHEYCRGMKFENVSVLISALDDFIQSMGLFWMDNSGVIALQESVFRVNCMDCLDRTNVVQAAIARRLLQITLRKLGRLLPDQPLPLSSRRVHNGMWANNGDAISRQYAGTAAMKGDFTRTGERKFAGVMKDGYNSANRYYLNRFRDSYRQTIIDMMQGNPISVDLSTIASSVKTEPEEEEEVWTSDKEECITQLVRHTELTLLPPDEECLGGWALIDPFSFVMPSDNPQDEDVIVMVTHSAYYVARYNDLMEEVFSYQRIPIEDLDKIEIGIDNNFFSGKYVFMKIFYKVKRESGYFHTLRTIQQRSLNESKGILLSIAEVFLNVCRAQNINLRVSEVRFDKRRTKTHSNIQPLSSKRTLSTSSRSKVTASSNNTFEERTMESSRSHSDSSLPFETKESDVESKGNNDFVNFHERLSPHRKEQLDSPTIIKSASDNCLTKNESRSEKRRFIPQSTGNVKFDNFLKKTKTAIGNVGPKFLEISLRNDGNESNESRNNESNLKNRFLKLNVNGPLKNVIPEFRNRIQTVLASPRTRKKLRVLSEQEVERRNKCKSQIIEL